MCKNNLCFVAYSKEYLVNCLTCPFCPAAGLLTTGSTPNAAASGKPSALGTLPNGTLGLAPGSTVVLNPTTSIRFADSASFTAPGGFPTATVASNAYHYGPCPPGGGEPTVTLDGRKALKGRPLKPLNGTALGPGTPPGAPAPSGLTGGLVLPATLSTQAPQAPATFQQQLQPGPFVQIASPYGGMQNIQLAPSLSGITVVPVSKATTLVQQQQQQRRR